MAMERWLKIESGLNIAAFDRWQLLRLSEAMSFAELFEEACPTLAPKCSYHRNLGIWLALRNYIPLSSDTYPQSTRRLLWEQDFGAAKRESRKRLEIFDAAQG